MRIKRGPAGDREILEPGDCELLLVTQGGGCGICAAAPEKERLRVDRDLDSGMVRGLLCARCMLGVRWFGGDPLKLAKAVRYITYPPGRFWRDVDAKDSSPAPRSPKCH